MGIKKNMMGPTTVFSQKTIDGPTRPDDVFMPYTILGVMVTNKINSGTNVALMFEPIFDPLR